MSALRGDMNKGLNGAGDWAGRFYGDVQEMSR